MRRLIIIAGILISAQLGIAGVADAKAKSTRNAGWPITTFVGNNSILANYYRDFVNRNPAPTSADKMHMFCDLLMSSDILADRLSQLGGKPSDLHSILMELGSYEFDNARKFSKDDRKHIRSLMQGLDMQLESIDHSLSTGTRNEFRREVLADIPPLNRVG